ncbi:eukaryotic translation initiation factor 4E type 1B [Puma concolor]|uniref:Eukaryotic translation initiation factor 4E type 1B n=1 Tax=Puma concolor TaxID=9696 RepID=A0A6P6HUU6_PUMCO|nr:eukaryotic translation initiation factor 4E type 1B [Puma concolor]
MASTLWVGEAEGGIQNWEEKEEKEEEKEGAVVAVLMAEGALNAPGDQLSQRRKEARDGGPQGIKLELHPLLNRWALWFFKNDRSRAWQDNLHLVTKFDTVEDFWASPREEAGWCGGTIKDSGAVPVTEVEVSPSSFWPQLLCLIGESFEEHSREVCGAVINIRTKGDKIAVWTREAENQAGVLHIGRVYKERLGLSTKIVIGYQAHADTATKSNSLAKNKFVV